MTRVCPNPSPWNAVYQRLLHVWECRQDLPKPPVPLILNGWVFTNDVDKMKRWQETLQWSQAAGCEAITSSLSDDDFYHVEEATSDRIGPMGGPLHRVWDFEPKQKPGQEAMDTLIQRLSTQWPELAADFCAGTQPIGFSGNKARRLVVAVTDQTSPSWGTWHSLSSDEAKRRTFTTFRKAINEALHPHEVDHIDFVIGNGDNTPNQNSA